MPLGWKPCRQIYETAPSPELCRRSATSILTSFRRSNRRAVSAGIEQREMAQSAWAKLAKVPTDRLRSGGMPAEGTMTRGKAERQPPNTTRTRVDAGVKELNEMTIGRTDDPEIPLPAQAFEAAEVFGTGSRTPSGPAVM